MTYNNRLNQRYEQYWQYTAAITDINSTKFTEALRIVADTIDSNNGSIISTPQYKKLQSEIVDLFGYPGNDPEASARKLLNQFVKIGFVTTGLTESRKETRDFLQAQTNQRRQVILANVFFHHNKLLGSVRNKDTSQINKVKFLVRTLEHCSRLDEDNLLGIMFTNPDNYPKGYLNNDELIKQTEFGESIGAMSRKYNQVNHLRSILKFLDAHLNVTNGIIYKSLLDADEDIARESALPENSLLAKRGKPPRCQMQQQLFREMLMGEVEDVKGINLPQNLSACMLTGLEISRQKLVASHIWPYRACSDDAEYDRDNGFLFGENIDHYFDRGLISFDNSGNVLQKPEVSSTAPQWSKRFNELKVDEHYLNPRRKRYLNIHRFAYGFSKADRDEIIRIFEELNS